MIVPKSTVAISSLLSLIGFILLVVTTCSVPVNENIYLFELRGVTFNETTVARVGVLGLCGDYIGRSARGEWTTMHDCSNDGPGFPITTTKEVTTSESGRVVPVEATVANRELTRALVFNPLSAAFAGIAVILGLLTYAIEPCLCLSIWTYTMLAISTPCAWVACAIDFTITLRSKARVNDFASRPEQVIHFKIGPTSWIALAAALALSAAIVAWTIDVFRRPQVQEARQRPRYSQKGSQGSISSMGYSSPSSSRRASYV